MTVEIIANGDYAIIPASMHHRSRDRAQSRALVIGHNIVNSYS